MVMARRDSKIMRAVVPALEAGETIKATEFADRNGLRRGSVSTALGALFKANKDLGRKRDGQGYVYYKITDSAVAVREELRTQLDTELAEQEQAAWTVLWESPDRILLAADGRVWWAVPLA